MTKTPLARGLGMAMVALLGFASVAPALAASGGDLLQQYVGDWRGRGQLQGARNETVVCRMSLTKGNQDKIIYNGRCTMAGTTMAMQGTVAYIEGRNQYVAAMTSNAQFSGQAVGQKRGETIVFTMQGTEKDQEGKPVNFTARLTFGGGKISTDFKMVYPGSGDTITASVPFSR